MQIISFSFFCYVLFVFVLLYIVGKNKEDERAILLSNLIILIASYVFILFADWRFALVLSILTITTWYSAVKKSIVGVVVALIVLGLFKYANFFIDSFSKIFKIDIPTLKILLPIGISFYTFSAISYIVEVKRDKIKAKSLFDVALFLSYFPKITSGPIQDCNDFYNQIEKRRKIGWESFSIGIQIFVFGLFKKIVLADRLSVFVNQVYETPRAFGSLTVFLAVIAYSFQIYYDFSGYSDMAIGVSRIIGIHLPRNFNLPYLSHNVTELWKRWHITLSTWLQKYVYIPLGGNRKGALRSYFNLICTMTIGGLWHGANLTYIIWGLLHGFALVVHKGWMSVTKSDTRKHSTISCFFAITITFIFTSICWVFFRSESISKATLIIQRVFSFEKGLEQPYLWLFITVLIFCISSYLSFVYTKKKPDRKHLIKDNASIIDGYYPIVDLKTFCGLVFFFVFCGMLLCLAYTGGSPFIYGNY